MSSEPLKGGVHNTSSTDPLPSIASALLHAIRLYDVPPTTLRVSETRKGYLLTELTEKRLIPLDVFPAVLKVWGMALEVDDTLPTWTYVLAGKGYEVMVAGE